MYDDPKVDKAKSKDSSNNNNNANSFWGSAANRASSSRPEASSDGNSTNSSQNVGADNSNGANPLTLPSISLPKGGGAIRGIGEKFSTNPVTGTASLNVPVYTSPGRSGFQPQLSLSYDSGAGNGPFGVGWHLSVPSITRKTDKGLPRYEDGEADSDVFILSETEDLVPVYVRHNSTLGNEDTTNPDFSNISTSSTVDFALNHLENAQLVISNGNQGGADNNVEEWVPFIYTSPSDANFTIKRYRPRIEGLFARVERWQNNTTGEIYWRAITKDNITSIYGDTLQSRVSNRSSGADSGINGSSGENNSATSNNNPAEQVFSWLLSRTFDDKGNVIVYEYKSEDSSNVPLSVAEQGRNIGTNRYLKAIKYGNLTPYFPYGSPDGSIPASNGLPSDWCFWVLFDYGEHETYKPSWLAADSTQNQSWSYKEDKSWLCRNDPFSSYRSCFEVRSYRLCQRVMMFHHFAELGNEPCLVRSTDFTYSSEKTTLLTRLDSVTQTSYFRNKENQSYLITSDPQMKDNVSPRSLPPLEFEYSSVDLDDTIKPVGLENLVTLPTGIDNLPRGVDGISYQWVDLDSEGLPGVLTEQAGVWFYKRNISALPVETKFKSGSGNISGITSAITSSTSIIAENTAQFEPLEMVAYLPSIASIGGGRQQFLDLEGDGQLNLVQFARPISGYYRRNDTSNSWEDFTPFALQPNIDWNNPNLRMVDLDGDGHADVLITEDEVFTWYSSLTTEGFGPPQCVRKPNDEEKGPALIFADGTQSIYLADFSGDGLNDLVRIRNGEVCYWPNLGYGQFGAKITMDNSPYFDYPDQFDQKRIKLADIDGSGTTDIIYLGSEKINLYFNQSGNSWSNRNELTIFPNTNDLTNINVVDLLGKGTSCLVWSSPLEADAARPMYYIDLMNGQKPHLLTLVKNNFGAETRVRYSPSTKFYLQDRYAGKPWITKLPFPVYVVERVETYDRISQNRFVSRYAYHHGYYDGVEREFRGFGMVEQWDTEEIEAVANDNSSSIATNLNTSSFVPPVHTKTWFHTGVYIDYNNIFQQYAREYYREDPRLPDDKFKASLLEETILPESLALADEQREACRALKGSILRQEIYADDGTPKTELPYSVSERNYSVVVVQPLLTNRHAVYFVHPCETIDYHYERTSPVDPRITHQQTLKVDEYGNVLETVAIGYGRATSDLVKNEDQQKQKQTLITYTKNSFTNPILCENAYRIPLACESRTYELTGTNAALNSRLSIETMQQKVKDAKVLEYQEQVDGVSLQKRLIECNRTLYRKNDLTASLALGNLESLALPYESYKLAFNSEMLQNIYVKPGKITIDQMTQALQAQSVGGYLLGDTYKQNGLFGNGNYKVTDPDRYWWIPSGQIFYSSNTTDNGAVELNSALQHFFLPCRHRDPFNQTATISYDNYNLFVQQSSDPLNNLVTVGERDKNGTLTKQGIDYRVLQPGLTMDPNRNRSAVAFDIFGMVVATAVMGKPEENFGDNLDNFQPNLTSSTFSSILKKPPANLYSILRNATGCFIYDLFAYINSQNETQPSPAASLALVREVHTTDAAAGQQNGRILQTFSYSDGFGREIQKKALVEPGPLSEGGQPVDPRWVVSGWTIFNNKGKPVRQYEPFFSPSHLYEPSTTVGVFSTLFYDPVERVVATLHPNHTYEKVVFDPWKQTSYDVNDNVLQSDPKNDVDVASYFQKLLNSDYLPSWYDALKSGQKGSYEQTAAVKASAHANTPTIAHFDTLGRTFLTMADNGTYGKYETRLNLDIEGNQREVIDAKDRIVMHYDYDMLGNHLYQASMEAGERWTLNDVAGKPIFAWDSRSHQFRTIYDPLRRPTDALMTDNSGIEVVVGRSVYGESMANPEDNNFRGKVVQTFDQAGVVTSNKYDFKGNLLQSQRQLAQEYKKTLDWSGSVPLEAEMYTSQTRYDALNRPIELVSPDNSLIRYTYNQSNLLERIDANLRGEQNNGQLLWTAFVNNIDYDAKGQRSSIVYGNGVRTIYSYDPFTFRLVRLQTLRSGDKLQDLSYTYDPVGNITHIQDDAQQTIFFRNRRVEPSNDYTYDAIYRLIEATGREHLGQNNNQPNPPTPPDAFDTLHTRLDQPGDGNAMGRYLESYVYDEVGNFLTMQHRGTDPSNPGWKRTYSYNETSLLESSNQNNRLSSTGVGTLSENYKYDAHGNMTFMQYLPLMQWDYRDQLQATAQQAVNNGGTPEITWYVYDSSGQRVRKVTESQSTNGQSPFRMRERVYLAGFEVYREYENDGTTIKLERETLHLAEDKKRIALVETRTKGNDNFSAQFVRYQYGNHLGSTNLELDSIANIICYEEYFPYGSTSYQAVSNQTETPKRFRYIGKERDEENKLYYHGARYYISWLGIWTSPDPAGFTDHSSLYEYCHSNPINFLDPNGKWDIHWDEVGKGVGYGILALGVGIVAVGAIVLTGGAAGVAVASFLGATATTSAAVGSAVEGAILLGFAAYGGYQTGKTIAEVATGRDDKGEKLKDRQRSYLLGSVAVDIAGIIVGARGAVRSRAQAAEIDIKDRAMIDRLISRRRDLQPTGPADRPGAVTLAEGRTPSGAESQGRSRPRTQQDLANPSESHAEQEAVRGLPSEDGTTIAVDQIPCSVCDPFLESNLPPGSRVIVPQEVGKPTPPRRVVEPNSSIRPQVSSAVKGTTVVEPRVILRTPQRPNLGRTITLAAQAPVYAPHGLVDDLTKHQTGIHLGLVQLFPTQTQLGVPTQPQNNSIPSQFQYNF